MRDMLARLTCTVNKKATFVHRVHREYHSVARLAQVPDLKLIICLSNGSMKGRSANHADWTLWPVAVRPE